MHHFHTLFDRTGIGAALIDRDCLKHLAMNNTYLNILGYSSKKMKKLTLSDITCSKDREGLNEQIQQMVAGKSPACTSEIRCSRKDGRVIWITVFLSLPGRLGQHPDSILAVIHDITQRKRTEEKHIFASKVFENSIEGIVVTDSSGTIMQVNPAFTAITGYTPEETIGRNPSILKSQRHSPAFYENMWHQLIEKGKWAGEIWNRRKNGEAYPEWMTISAVKNPQGKTTNYVSIFHEISELKRRQEALEHQAQHDALTGLPNRVLINDRLEMALARMKRNKTRLALLYLDLDNFKHINDAFGHPAGDKLLIEVAKRLNHILRTGDTMARLGGDEFLILLSEVDTIDDVSLIAVRLIECLQQPFYHEQIEYFISASIGITVAPEDGCDAVSLVKFADNAMYRAKSLGRNNYQFFTPELDIQAHLRISTEMELRNALEKEAFELFYQPLIRIDGGDIVGVDALIRWHHNGKLIPPADFIPLAEDSGLILPIGEWILKSAMHQAKEWQDQGFQFGLHVNVSLRQFTDQDLASVLKRFLDEEKLDPDSLCLEITESMIAGNLANASKVMGTLRELGIKFYLDDFGNGFSSLSQLNRLPIDGLRIGSSFIKSIVDDAGTRAIVAAFISLARALGLVVIAEGIENQTQKEILGDMGPLLIQGNLISPPVPAAQLLEYLSKDRSKRQAVT